MFHSGPPLMFDPASVSELTGNALGKVSQFADAFFVIVITFLGFIAWRRGEREGKNESKMEGVSMPTYLMAHDAAKAIAAIEEASQKANAILSDIVREVAAVNRGQNLTHELLADIRNNQQVRETMAHPKVSKL